MDSVRGSQVHRSSAWTWPTWSAWRAEGIVTFDQMIARAAAPEARSELSARTAIPAARIEEHVKLSDISRVEAIKAKRARLYVDVSRVTEYIRRSGFDGTPTLPKEARSAVARARVVW